ncbi:MAG: CDP-diacylglycerol--glycerol-3-phosphate 3-phosphatidyltransferase [Planctomycetes bacterium]|nr:CDP-diacylglycerol--glycerol-3-phosphate 3-phosphatidyltransferase [Planctomycetota bacterium]
MATTEPTTSSKPKSGQNASSGNPFNRDALNIPNLITISRLVLAVVLFTLIYIHGFWMTSAILFVVAAWTDFLDGYIARKYGMVTVLGRILDPFVDKIIIGGAFIFLSEKTVTLENGEVLRSGVNAWMAMIVIGREMFVTSLRAFLERQGRDFSANWSGKLKMVLQCIAVPAALLSLDPRFDSDGFRLLRDVLLWSAVAVTVFSGVIYVFRAATLLESDSD